VIEFNKQSNEQRGKGRASSMEIHALLARRSSLSVVIADDVFVFLLALLGAQIIRNPG